MLPLRRIREAHEEPETVSRARVGTPEAGPERYGGDTAFYRPLTADGFDVYVYDQVGSGGSSRLADPSRYGVERYLADLEEIRKRMGADRLVLVGHSYGGALAVLPR